MLTTLKSGKGIRPEEIYTITKNGENYLIKMASGELLDLAAAEYAYFMTIYRILLEIEDGKAVNMLMVESTNGDKITLKNGETLAMTPEKLEQFKNLCKPLDLEKEIQFLEGKNIDDNYNKLP